MTDSSEECEALASRFERSDAGMGGDGKHRNVAAIALDIAGP
jgi:hypothetical protein